MQRINSFKDIFQTVLIWEIILLCTVVSIPLRIYFKPLHCFMWSLTRWGINSFKDIFQTLRSGIVKPSFDIVSIPLRIYFKLAFTCQYRHYICVVSIPLRIYFKPDCLFVFSVCGSLVSTPLRIYFKLHDPRRSPTLL